MLLLRDLPEDLLRKLATFGLLRELRSVSALARSFGRCMSVLIRDENGQIWASECASRWPFDPSTLVENELFSWRYLVQIHFTLSNDSASEPHPIVMEMTTHSNKMTDVGNVPFFNLTRGAPASEFLSTGLLVVDCALCFNLSKEAFFGNFIQYGREIVLNGILRPERNAPVEEYDIFSMTKYMLAPFNLPVLTHNGDAMHMPAATHKTVVVSLNGMPVSGFSTFGDFIAAAKASGERDVLCRFRLLFVSTSKIYRCDECCLASPETSHRHMTHLVSV